MFCDEGVGAYAVEAIRANYRYPANLTIVEGGTLGFRLMEYYQSYDTIVIVGTGSHQGAPGTIAVRSAEELIAEGKVKKTANEVEIAMMIEICSFHEAMGEVELISIVPEDIVSVRNGLSETLLEALPAFEAVIVDRLRLHGVAIEPLPQRRMQYAAILDAFANPKQATYANSVQPEV